MPTGVNWVLGPDGRRGECWNVIAGCSPAKLSGKPSPACERCYAARLAATRLKHRRPYAGKAFMDVGPPTPRWTGRVQCLEDRLEIPLRWRKPRGVFVADMADLFHPKVPGAFIAQVFCVLAKADQHVYYLLTKRPDRMAAFFELCIEPGSCEHILAGTTVENQEAADERIPELLKCGPYVRGVYLSCEPLLGPILLPVGDEVELAERRMMGQSGAGMGMNGQSIDWVIAGGETGPGARPAYPEWFRGLRNQCEAAGVPFFFKQWGTAKPDVLEVQAWKRAGRDCDKPKGGRLLDGVEHNGHPLVGGR